MTFLEKRHSIAALIAGVAITAATTPLVSQAQSQGFEPQVVGGVEAAKGQFPFIVSLQSEGSGHFCGGTLVGKEWVLTAAHCVHGGARFEPSEVPAGLASKLKIVVGLHQMGDVAGTETFGVKKIVVHPEYGKKMEHDADFALVQLDGSSKFEPARLNSAEITIDESEQSAPVSTVAGWGVTSQGSNEVAKVLMTADIPLASAKRCEAAYPGEISDRMICAGYEKGGKDACQGDSGGPLLVNGALAGVVSWGQGCAQAGKYGVYGKVSSVADWISSETR